MQNNPSALVKTVSFCVRNKTDTQRSEKVTTSARKPPTEEVGFKNQFADAKGPEKRPGESHLEEKGLEREKQTDGNRERILQRIVRETGSWGMGHMRPLGLLEQAGREACRPAEWTDGGVTGQGGLRRWEEGGGKPRTVATRAPGKGGVVDGSKKVWRD